jgi:2-dehydropantoate 2-reductase
MRLAVLGSGGIGGHYGALLAKAGHDFVFIARRVHLEALRRRGLTIRSRRERRSALAWREEHP